MNIKHHLTYGQIDVLESVHAYLTESGWVIPEWLIVMRQFVNVKVNKK